MYLASSGDFLLTRLAPNQPLSSNLRGPCFGGHLKMSLEPFEELVSFLESAQLGSSTFTRWKKFSSFAVAADGVARTSNCISRLIAKDKRKRPEEIVQLSIWRPDNQLEVLSSSLAEHPHLVNSM